MTYAVTNPPFRVSNGAIGGGPSLWMYNSADAHTAVDAVGYFTNGSDLGMTVGDSMVVNDTSTPTCTIHYVVTVTAGGAGSITVATLS